MYRFLLMLAALSMAWPAAGQQNAFDLSGPGVMMDVTRDGTTLPLSAVPALRTGDTLTVSADLPDDQSARYLLVIGFLRGATNPPPRDWFTEIETWRRKRNQATITVPPGAENAVVFFAPRSGGGFDAVVDAVRGRPGVFVRAAQDLHQASLDRMRLEAFVAGVARAQERTPERLTSASQALGSALAIRVNPDCLTRARALQAACLTQNREGMVLQAGRGATLTDTLVGAPTELAYRIAATPEGGAGYYSPYIGLARDLARLFGAFRTAQYQYLPALLVADGEAMRLRLNTPPSFQNPRSVLVAALPPVAAVSPAPPAWRIGRQPLCLSRDDAVLPVDDQPLLYATGYGRDLALRVEGKDTVPLVADAARGGLVPATRGDVSVIGAARFVGAWGFDRFEGPTTTIGGGNAADWRPVGDATVVVGRDHPLLLTGGTPTCIDRIALRRPDGQPQPLEWKAVGTDRISVTLPLAAVPPGPVTLIVGQAGRSTPQQLELVGQAEASRIDGFTLHRGDTAGTLSGKRLDQVAELMIGATRFVPVSFDREGDVDRATLSSGTASPDLTTGQRVDATVRLRDGRTARVAVRVAEARPQTVVVSRNVERPARPGLRIALPPDIVTLDGRLTFSLRAAAGAFGPRDAIDVAAGERQARLSFDKGTLQRAGAEIAVATIAPAALFGPGASGAVRVRIVRDRVAGDWAPLAAIVRTPTVSGVVCPADRTDCLLAGSDLFTLSAVATTADFATPAPIPAGFVGREIAIPRPAGPALYVRLHDAPDRTFELPLDRTS